MAQQDQRRALASRRNPDHDRVVVVCDATGNTVALVQVVGKAPARLVTEQEDILLGTARNGMTARCRCAAGRHALDVFRYQAEVFKQSKDPSLRRPLRVTV